MDRLLLDFHRTHGFADFQRRSYNFFVEHSIPQLLLESRTESLVLNPERTFGYKDVLYFRRVSVETPHSTDLSFGRRAILTLDEAIPRGLTYSIHIYVDLVHEVYTMRQVDFLEPSSDPNVRRGPIITWLPGTIFEERKVSTTVNGHFHLFDFPCMVGSKWCHGTDEVVPIKPYGHFVIGGLEKYMECMCKLRNNLPITRPPNAAKSSAKLQCEIRCLAENKYRSTSTLFFALRDTPTPIITVKIPFVKCDVENVLHLFTFFGFPGLEDIIRFVLPIRRGCHTESKIAAMITLWHEDHSTEREILEYLSRGVKGVTLDARKRQVRQQLRSEFFPHVGVTFEPDVVAQKMILLGAVVRRLLQTFFDPKKYPMDDREHEAFSAIELPHMSLGTMLRQLLSQFMKTMRQFFCRKRKNSLDPDGMKEQLLMALQDATEEKLTRRIVRAFRVGDLTVVKEGTNSQVHQILQLPSSHYLCQVSHLRRISLPVNHKGHYTHGRGVHPTQFGLICPCSATEDESCGLIRTLAQCTDVRLAIPMAFLQMVCENMTKITSAEQFFAETPQAVVFVNGAPLGFTSDRRAFVDSVRVNRRLSGIKCNVWDLEDIWVWGDSGAMTTPLIETSELRGIVVPPGLRLYDVLESRGVIVNLDAIEMLQTRVGPGAPYDLIHPSQILSVNAAMIPFAGNNQTPRVTYGANMLKQAASASTGSRIRFDTNRMNILVYPQKPLAMTTTAKAFGMREFPFSVSAIVAVGYHEGMTQEDPLVLSRTFVDLGGLMILHYRIFTTAANSEDSECFESFEHPILRSDLVFRQVGVCYDKLDPEDGCVGVGTHVRRGDALVGKVRHQYDRASAKWKFEDASMVLEEMDPSEEGVVDAVARTQTADGKQQVLVRIVFRRNVVVGDKLSSFHSQKGVVSAIVPREDLPFVAYGPLEGMTPDIIMSIHGMPSRMTVGQIRESVTNLAAVQLGVEFSGDAFTKAQDLVDVSEVQMIDGTTGEVRLGTWFIGIVPYMRLKHMVLDKLSVRDTGRINAFMHQPVDGRASTGGQRFGQMEGECVFAYGASKFLHERLTLSSDHTTVNICETCGVILDRSTHGQCGNCMSRKVVTMTTTYSYEQVVRLLSIMGISVEHEF